MAIQPWERSLLPQGGVETPRGTDLGAVIGAGAQDIGRAAQGAVYDIARADAVMQQKNDSAWLGQQKPQSILDLNGKIAALNDPQSQSYIDPTRPDYEATIGKTIDDYAETATKTAPSADSQAEIRSYLTGLKASYVESAGRNADQSKLAKRIGQIDESNRKWGSIIVTSPGQFDTAVQEQEKLIRSQGLSPENTDTQVRKMKATMAGFAMNGQASTNPAAFLKNIGKWGDQGATPGDIAQAQGIAEAEQKRQQAEAKAEASRRQMQEQVSVAALADDAISSVQANGGVMPLVNGKPMLTPERVRSAYPNDPVRSQRIIDKMNQAQFIGQAKVQIAGQTKAEDDALQAKVAPVAGGIFTEDDATVQKAVNAAIKAKQDALSDEIKQDIQDGQGDAAVTFNKNAADWLQTATATGVVAPEARVAAVESGSADAKSFLDKLEQQARLTQASMQIKDQPNSADQTMADRLGLDIASTGPGSGARAAEAKATAQAIDEKQKAIVTDPGGYFGVANPGVKSGWAAVDANPADQAVAENTVAMSVAAQMDYGLGPDQVQPFPNGRAAQYANTIMSAPADQALATIDYVRSISGESGLKQVLGQKGIPGMAKFLAFADLPAQEPVRAAALESMKLKPEELDKLVKDRGVKTSEIDEAVTASIGPLLNTLPPGAAGPYHDALAQITKLYVAKGMQPGAAAQQAWSAFDDAYAFTPTYRIPRTFNDQKVQDGVNAVMQKLGQFAIVPQSGAPEGAPADYALNQTIKQLQTGGARWVTNADDTGLILTYDVDQNGIPGAAVKTSTGRLEVLFSDLESGKYGFVSRTRPSPGAANMGKR